jgi:oligosaccharide repeat unit polymerase
LVSLILSRYVLGLHITSSPMLYLILLSLFHLGLLVPAALGLYDIERIAWFDLHGASRAIGLVVYSILAYQVGVFAALFRTPGLRIPPDQHDSRLQDRGVFFAGCLLFAVAVIMFVTGLIKLDPVDYYRLTYSETFRLRAESDPRLFGSGITIASIGLCLCVSGASKRQLHVAFLFAGVWVSGLFYLGFRGLALIAGVIVYAVALKKGWTFPKWVPWCGVALLLVAVPMERIARDEPLNARSISDTFRDVNLLDAPAEMGASIRPLVETVDLVDSTNYRYGRTYLTGLKGILPNLALRWEAPASESLDDLPPSHWITAVVDPWSYRNYGGMGFSAIAEPYMNFGTVGVIVYFIFVGFSLVRLEQFSVRNSYALATWGLILGPLLWTTRNDFSNFFRPAVWGLACLALIHVYFRGYSIFVRSPRHGKVESKPALREVRQI